MWAATAKSHAASVLARMLSRYANADRLSGAAARLEHWRTLFDEATGAVWHFAAMPSRRDLRVLQRRVSALKQRVEELDEAVAKLERVAAASEAAEKREGNEASAATGRSG